LRVFQTFQSSLAGNEPKNNYNDPVNIWKSFKAEKKVRSDGMEKLLELTELKKVKLSTLDVFKTSLIIQKMDLKMRKANQMTYNYCFLGDAISVI
jgi:hypothetical protein